MKVVYSVAADLGGSGIGTTAFEAVRGIYSAGVLQTVFCSLDRQNVIPGSFVSPTGTSFFEKMRFFPSRYQWLLKDVTHDLKVSLMLHSIKASDLNIFHVWNGHGLYSMRKARKLGAKIVVERASSHPLTFERIMSSEYKFRGLKFRQMLSFNKSRLLEELREADYVTAPSEFSYRSLLENGVAEERIIKIPYGVDLERFRPVGGETRKGKFRVLFVGQVGLRKGALYLLEAWKKIALREAELILLGQFDSETDGLFKPYRSCSSVKFAGFADALPYYQSSHIFALPSLEEGSALVTYEALACGLPSLVTFESGSVMEEGKEGYFVPSKNIEALAERLEFLYQNPSVVREMSVRARQRAQNYSWESYGKNLVSSYERINGHTQGY